MDFIRAIVRPSYWYTHQHVVPEFWMYTLIALFGLLVVTSLICWALSKRRAFSTPVRTYLRRWGAFSFSAGAVGFVLLFFSWQRVAFFSARGVYLIWLVAFGYWAVSLLKYGLKDLPRKLADYEERLRLERYLPSKS
jgi:hypothetical protein